MKTTIITVGQNQLILNLQEKQTPTINVTEIAKTLNKPQLNVFKYNIYNRPITHAIIQLNYLSKAWINAITLALYQQTQVHLTIYNPTDPTQFRTTPITLHPNQTQNYEAHNILRQLLIDQAKNSQKSEEYQQFHELQKKINNLLQYKALHHHVKTAQEQIHQEMLLLGYQEDQLPTIIRLPALTRTNYPLFIGFIQDYARLYDIPHNQTPPSHITTQSVELWNRYGSGSASWILNDKSHIKKEHTRTYSDLYERTETQTENKPDLTALYQILYYMTKQIAPLIDPPFEVVSYDELEYQLSDDTND